MTNRVYFDRGGSFGDGDHLVVIDTEAWTDAEWDEVDAASDSERQALALEIAARHESACLWSAQYS